MGDLTNQSYVQETNVPPPFTVDEIAKETSDEQTLTDYVPACTLVSSYINKHPLGVALLALMDSGSNFSLIHRSKLPPGCVPSMIPNPQTANTAAGNFHFSSVVVLEDAHLPEFSRSLKIERMVAYVFDAPCKYDLIIGRNWLNPNKFDIQFSTKTMHWFGREVPMKQSTTPELFYINDDDFHNDDPFSDLFTGYKNADKSNILPAKYEGVESLDAVVSKQDHLSTEEKKKLRSVFEGHDKLFEGKLGCYPGKKIHLDLKPGSKPHHARPYPVPLRHTQLFQNEAAHLCNEGVLTPCGATEHAYPTFIVPKKDNRVRWVSDFRILNDMLVRKQYRIPRIQDIIRKRGRYRYMTKIDISMQFYTFELDEESSWLCVIVTPFGKYRYLRLPMGVCNSPDFAQDIMEDIFKDMMHEIDIYIDDIGIFDEDYDTHMTKVRKVLTRLQENGFTVNPLKCEWAVQETDWLGYWFTPNGIKPWKKKIDAILQLDTPKSVSDLRSFIGAVNFYRDMWPRRAHLLSPLTSLTGKSTLEWTPAHQRAFERMKALVVTDAMLAFPDHNLPFHIHTDSSDFQLGAMISQNDRPIAYYTRKLTPAQRNYTTMEKELLAIVAVLKEYRTTLFGAQLHIHTDHKNLTYQNLNTQRVIRWRLYIEEFSPTFHYVKGEDNVLADYLSRAPILEEKEAVPSQPSQLEELIDDIDDNIGIPPTDQPSAFSCSLPASFYSSPEIVDCLSKCPDVVECFCMTDDDIAECFMSNRTPESFLNVPPGPNPLDYARIAERQGNDARLQQLHTNDPIRYPKRPFHSNDLIVFRPDPTLDEWKIYLPTSILNETINWFHRVLLHVGTTRLHASIATHFFHPELKRRITEIVSTCRECQQYKRPGRGYGHLPPREALFQPFTEVAVDSIGPWRVTVNGQQMIFRALTMIDTVSNLVEIKRCRATGLDTARTFEREWLYRYPRPNKCIHDNGPEFNNHDFQFLLTDWGVKAHPISVANPQANSICERLHLTVANLISVFVHSNPPQTAQAATNLVDEAIATASHAYRSTVHSTLGVSPGALVYHRDMLLDVPYVADLITLRNRRQLKIDENLRKENNRRRNYDYRVGESVYELSKVKDPLFSRIRIQARGPFPILQVHSNGTLTIRRTNQVQDRVNIRHLRPAIFGPNQQ